MSRVDAIVEAKRSRYVRLLPVEAAVAVDQGALLVDIRPVAQRAVEGEVPGAIVIERNVLEWRLDPTSAHKITEVDKKGARIVVLCSEGYASSLAAASLLDVGVDATDVVGGFRDWVGAGLPHTGGTAPGSTVGHHVDLA
jgi:rhodanese-related sulfurtransferase